VRAAGTGRVGERPRSGEYAPATVAPVRRRIAARGRARWRLDAPARRAPVSRPRERDTSIAWRRGRVNPELRHTTGDVRVLVVDDEPLARAGLRAILREE